MVGIVEPPTEQMVNARRINIIEMGNGIPAFMKASLLMKSLIN
jgi:hypothetical protein